MQKAKYFSLILITLFIFGCAQQTHLPLAKTVRTIPISDHAWSGSSINVLAGVKQTLYTHGVHQYAAFYNASGLMVLAKRRIGENAWQTHTTSFLGNVNDAHNHISLAVDGSGILHVAWDHHNSPLKYARAHTPGSLAVTKKAMLGQLENSVTYPQFYSLPNGDLLFQYRDGGSGRGTLVLNQYSVKNEKWQRVQNALIDGEGQRSAYWDMLVDNHGKIHLAWNWRETPDVATNHDLMYAVSNDSGKTWQTIEGTSLSLPITQANSPVVQAIAQNRKLMNPPVLAIDVHGNPFISSYWANGPLAKPQQRVLYHKNSQWHLVSGPKPEENFNLSGRGTKRLPWSRAALLVESSWNNSWFHLVFRDDQSGGIIAQSVYDLEKPKWQTTLLLDDPMGAWEPSIDPQQWQRLKQAHMLLQNVEQADGNDHKAFQIKPSSIDLFIWSPKWEKLQPKHESHSVNASHLATTNIDQNNVLALAEKTAKWQWQNVREGWDYQLASWTMAPLYIGMLAVAPLIPEANLEEMVLQRANELNWQPHERVYDADDYCVIQPYLRLYLKHKKESMLAPSKARLDTIIQNPSPSNLDWGSHNARDRWSWSDALYMGPMSFLLMYQATGDDVYLDFMNKEWWATYERLYSQELGLYFRDESYLDLREQNGKTIHWSRGVGWSFAGLAQVLEIFPKNHKDYPRYLKQFKQMAAAFKQAQQEDGLWRPGLLDPTTHTATETSGSAFAVFSMAWGVNHGVLEKADYEQAISKGWHALSNSVTSEGKLKNVQPIGAAPEGFDPNNSEPFATGAFLMAASEIYEFAD